MTVLQVEKAVVLKGDFAKKDDFKKVPVENYHQALTVNKFSEINIDLPDNYKKIVENVLQEMPKKHLSSLERIIAEPGSNARRGLASFKSIYLGVDVMQNDAEFRRVFIHEIGHVIDLGVLTASNKEIASDFRDGVNIIYQSDPSLLFYELCWLDEYTPNGNCNDLDFVSEYSQTDVFEDFAESYLLFVENNASFLEMTQESEVLAKKYNFLAQYVFSNNFKKTPLVTLPRGERVWDLTLVN